jgi:hypothetical protein
MHIPQTLHPEPSTNLHATTTDPTEQPTTKTEVLALNTSAPNTMLPPPTPTPNHRNQEDLQQDSMEEIEAVIEDELALLCQENKCLRLMQEHLARWKAMAKRSQVMQQQIEQKRATQVEMQRAIEGIHQQEHEPSMQKPPLQQQQPHQPSHQRTPQQQCRQTQGSVNNKCPLADNLKLAPWPLQYRAIPLPKYYGESDPRKFLMSYEAAIASSGGDDITLAESFIISLENAVANWYERLLPISIASWA